MSFTPTPSLPPTIDVPSTMRAVVQDRYGIAELRVDSIDVPSIRDDEVLIRVEAAGIDRGTWHLVTGLPLMARLEMGLRTPKRRVPGFDVSGVVVKVGAKVEQFKQGDAVCGIARGSFAEYAPALARKIVHRPEHLDATAAGTLAISGLTALQAVRDSARVRPGDRILVLGASGGVGTYAVQIASSLGAEVTAVCSAPKADLVRSLGAARVLDYATTDALDGSVKYHAIIDIGGRRPLRDLRRALEPRGAAVLIGGEGGGRVTGGFPGRLIRGVLLSLAGRRRFVGFIAKERADHIGDLVQLIESDSLHPQVDRVVELEQVPYALRDLEGGKVRGKIALRL